MEVLTTVEIAPLGAVGSRQVGNPAGVAEEPDPAVLASMRRRLRFGSTLVTVALFTAALALAAGWVSLSTAAAPMAGLAVGATLGWWQYAHIRSA